MRMRNMHIRTARPHVRIKKKHKKKHFFTVFIDWPVSTDAQDNRAASWEPWPDPIATNPQHKRSRLNGSRKYLATRGDLLQKNIFRVVEYFIFSAYSEKEGGDVVADQHLHRLHYRQLPHCEDHSKRLGDCPQVRSQSPSSKTVSCFTKKLWGSRWKSFTAWAKVFLSLLIKKIISLLLQKCIDWWLTVSW